MELTEDDVLVGRRVIIGRDDTRDGIELGRRQTPILPLIRGVLTTLGIDVDLRMNGDLSQPQQQLESLCTRQEFTGILLGHGLGGTLYTMIELLFLLGGEWKNHLVNNGNRRSTLNDTSKGIEGSVKKEMRQQVKVTWFPSPQGRVGNTEKGKKSDDVFQGIDKGSTRDNPAKRSDNLSSGTSHVTVAIANLMSLIQHHTVPLHRVKEGGVGV
jgi:hypothetical protein